MLNDKVKKARFQMISMISVNTFYYLNITATCINTFIELTNTQ